MEYNFKEIEQKWQKSWVEKNIYRVDIDHTKPKMYILDMFPYPSGAGLHVGHPLGYIASDIYSRYKRQQGFNVLHPMGYDAFGLPAEQYAIQTGQHPATTTDENILRYREQLDRMGFSFDWSRQIITSDPAYYKWTQWAFIELFNSYYDKELDKAQPINKLIEKLEKTNLHNWNSLSNNEKESILLENYRLAYQSIAMVNWCQELGTVLANDEVKDGLSERGGYPVIQRPMKQWLLRVSTYAQRLLDGLDKIDWSDSLKDIQRNWIGRSEGATVLFSVENSDRKLEVFTTRPDTIFGSTFMVLAPEHELVKELTTRQQSHYIETYIAKAGKRTERERMADTKNVSGCFTGSYALNPFSGKKMPIYISDYVLAGYGSGAIMAVPAHDSRDYAFAKHFELPIIPVVDSDISEQSYDAKEGEIINSDFLNGLQIADAILKMFSEIEERGLGHSQINYRLRDAIFSRQRYWGEPIPIKYNEDGWPQTVELDKLPLELPPIDNFTPTEDGQPPLARIAEWEYETSTMPGFAGSSAYSIRYMDPHNSNALVSKEANQYWQNVDLYVGGIEHAAGHLIYSRFWNKFLFDRGYICCDEPYKKLINQGMIQGRSSYVYRIKGENRYVSYGLKDKYDTQTIHVDINIVENDLLDIEAFRNWLPENDKAEFVLEDGRYVCGWAVEKMSKSMHNVVNPDTIIERYGADTLRMYEMFLGPLQQSKPWDTNGIDGVHRFLRKLCRFYTDVENKTPTAEELKTLHKTIKKVSEDIESFSFNTAVSTFMTCLNDLSDYKSTSIEILKPLAILISPFTPHLGEELWSKVGGEGSVFNASYPKFDPQYLVESVIEYPISFNGKVRFTREFAIDLSKEEIEQAIREDELTARYSENKPIKRMIIVPRKIVNVVY